MWLLDKELKNNASVGKGGVRIHMEVGNRQEYIPKWMSGIGQRIMPQPKK